MDDDDKEYYMQFIQKDKNKYIIHRMFKNKDYVYDTVYSLNDALLRCEKLDESGWPLKINKNKKKEIEIDQEIKTLATKEDIRTNIKLFIDNYISILPHRAYDNDITIEQIYIVFKKVSSLPIDELTFQNYFYNVYREYQKASITFNNTTRYNLEFRNINKPITKNEFHHFLNHEELIDRIDKFIVDCIGIYPDKANEEDITINELYQAFSNYLKQYNEYTKLKIFKKYFDQIYFEYENADKIISKYPQYNAVIITDETEFID